MQKRISDPIPDTPLPFEESVSISKGEDPRLKRFQGGWKWRLLIASFILFGMIAFTLWIFSPDDDLIRKSVFVAEFKRSMGYCSLGSQSVLVVRHVSDSKKGVFTSLFNLLDLKTGRETPCPLDKISFPLQNRASILISPDSKSILLTESFFRSVGPLSQNNRVYDFTRVSIHPINGQKSVEFVTRTERKYVWSSDSLQIAGISEKDLKYQIYDINGKTVRSDIPRESYAPTMGTVYDYSSSWFMNDRIKVIRNPGWSHQMDSSGWGIFEERIGNRVSEISKKAIRFPASQGEAFGTFSPDGKRIAWVLMQVHSPGDMLLERMNFQPTVQHFKIGLWTSDGDGREWKRVGSIQGVSKNMNFASDVYAFTSHWMPDNKRIAFAWRDKLYTVEAE